MALDYFISGVKIDNSHLGCIYNIACCHFFAGKFDNAKKWFGLAIKVDAKHVDSYYGKAAACLKLGLNQQAYEAISVIDH